MPLGMLTELIHRVGDAGMHRGFVLMTADLPTGLDSTSNQPQVPGDLETTAEQDNVSESRAGSVLNALTQQACHAPAVDSGRARIDNGRAYALVERTEGFENDKAL
jgi:hypothetical protein